MLLAKETGMGGGGSRWSDGTVQELMQRFLDAEVNRRLPRRHAEVYRGDLEALIRFLRPCGVKQVEEIEAAYLNEFIEECERQQTQGRGTPLRRQTVLRLLFGFAVGMGLLRPEENPAHYLKPRQLPAEELFDDASLALLKRTAALPTDGGENIRDRAFFRVMAVGGMWLGGMLALDLFDPADAVPYAISPEGVVRYRGRGGLTAHTFLDAETVRWVEIWVRERYRFVHGDAEPALWLSRQSRRILRPTIATRLRGHAELVGFSPVNSPLVARLDDQLLI